MNRREAFSARTLNSLKLGERRVLIPKQLAALRIPGGYIYEYFHQTDDSGYTEITAATFVSTNELTAE